MTNINFYSKNDGNTNAKDVTSIIITTAITRITKILHSSSNAQDKGDSKNKHNQCSILMFMWSFGPLVIWDLFRAGLSF